MNTKNLFKKRYVSIVLTGIFIVISVTGILMFFMIESHAMNSVHAWLGMFFVGIGIYHLIKNLSSLKNYLKYKSSLISLSLILILSIYYALPKNEKLVSPKKEIMKAIFMQPISVVCIFFKKDINKTISHLKSKNIQIKNSSQSLMQIAKKNKKEVKEVFFIFFEKTNNK